MDLKQIEYIVKIAETGNITRAAEQLFVTQSRPQPAASQTGKCLGHQAVLPQKARPYANGCRKGLSKIWSADAH